MIKENAFDAIAATYDASFSKTIIGANQRRLVRMHLQTFLKGKGLLKILEINCGTGDDALWLASLGHEVVATDASALMIAEAKRKASITSAEYKISFFQCSFEKLYSNFKDEKFDLIFSNFSGLNCIAPGELQILGSDLNFILYTNGHLAAVIFGKFTFWEFFYFSYN